MIIVYVLSTEDTKITIGTVEHNDSFMQYQLNKVLRHVLEREVLNLRNKLTKQGSMKTLPCYTKKRIRYVRSG